jgi:hypothetical protein
MTAQETTQYFLVIKEGYELGAISKTVNLDESLTLGMANTDLANTLNSMSLTIFEQAFPGLQIPRLTRIYLMEVPFETSMGNISSRQEVEKVEMVPRYVNLLEEETFAIQILPNDYEDVIVGGRNQELDLIKAPLAWTISTGENMLVGLSDSQTRSHEDLDGQVIQSTATDTRFHGTGVAGRIAAITNNNLGVASLAYNSKIVSANPGYSGVLELAQVPGVKVINCSWSSIGCIYNSEVEDMYSAIAEEYGVLVVCAAGNNAGDCPPNVYRYPASYVSTLSVTSVGSKFPIGYFHDLIDPSTGTRFWDDSWKDCHYRRPFYSEGSHTHNDKVDVTAPGYLVTGLTDQPDYPSGYRLGSGTSSAAPYVSALAALIFSINPDFTPDEVKNIIKNTADNIYNIPYNQDFFGQLGTGRINAFRAVKTADCMVNPTPGLDLAMQNSNIDDFSEPDTDTEIVWNSEDIWVRNENDGNLIDVHQNPEYDPNNPNYVYVRVTNNSCTTSSGTDQLKLYWAKANTTLYWPQNWNGTMTIEDPLPPHNDILMGDEVGTLNIPVLQPGQSKIIEFEWDVPNPEDYINLDQGNPWHFCLLARIVSLQDPMTFPEVSAITQNVTKNNNIVWKNTTVVDIYPNVPSQIGGVVAVGNPYSTINAFNLQFIKDSHETGPAIYEEAEVSVEMDNVLYDAWVRGGMQGENLTATSTASQRRIAAGNNMTLNNILFNPNEIGTAYVKFNFLTSQLTAKKDFTYHAILRDATINEVIGGETYEIHKRPRPTFDADAGSDETIDRSESVTITAAQINESAVYNWYDPDGNLIYTGTNLTVSPDVTKTYKLEIITDTDGYKDYDEVEVTVNPYKLESLVPNPATSQVTVNYIADKAVSAYLMVVSIVTGISNNYILDVNETSINLNVSGYSTGMYSVALVCDGEIVDSKNLAKQ